MAVYTETIELKDNVSGAAEKAAQQVSILEGAIASTENALTKAAATGNIKKYQALSKDLSAYKSALSAIPPVEEKAVVTTDKITKSTFNASQAMQVGKETIGAAITGIKNAFASLASGDVKGAIAGVTEAVAGIAKMLDLVVPGLGQAVSTIVTIAGGFVGITAGLIQSGMAFAISSNQSKTAMIGMFDAMAGGAGKGAEFDDMLSGLADQIGITKDELAPMTKSFLSMGITGTQQLKNLTLAAISANAIMGDPAAGKAFENLTSKIQLAAQTGQGLKIPLKGLGSLADMGLTVDDVAKKMGVSAKKLADELKNGSADAAKFGDALQNALIEKGAGPLAKLGMSVENIKKKFLQDLGDVFEDIDVGPFMEQVKDLFNIFGQAKPSGQALKSGIGGFFKEVFATATKVVPYVKHFLLDIVIYGLKAYIALKPIVKAIAEFGQSATGMTIITTVLSSVWQIMKVLGVAVLIVIAAFTALWAAMIVVTVAVWTLVGAIIGFVSDANAALTSWVTGAAKAAYDFVAGLVNGIMNGGAQVVGAVTGLADKAKGAFKSALGINSPSKVMMQMGGFIGEGAAHGIEQSHGEVAAASSGLAGAAVGGFAGGASSGGGGGAGSGGVVVTIEAGAFVIQGAGKSAEGITEELVSLIFERVALAQGL
jgi:hypothetical protein